MKTKRVETECDYTLRVCVTVKVKIASKVVSHQKENNFSS